jgi:hypothetical protein
MGRRSSTTNEEMLGVRGNRETLSGEPVSYEQAQGHERQSIDWVETLSEARLLAAAYSGFYVCVVVVDDTWPNDEEFTHLIAEYQNGVQVGNYESVAQM